ncbi:hypothetical protein CP532_3356 [Ophiocordyceps camponoti-leonardi (nom. inval.)]|nr:hypothetical protein CP532_3356 [Ophiocordyceps camponoti-leonardi (nom. inval.)]
MNTNTTTSDFPSRPSSSSSTTTKPIDNEDDDETKTRNDSETRSLTDSIRQHVLDGNLRYHAYHQGTYAFPNDETEQWGDELKHDLTVDLCDGRLFLAPCHELFELGAQVLDLVADLYPKSRFHGMDLSPIQPDWVPENVEFFVDDFEDERGWGYEANSFDYIHVRHTTHSIKNRPQVWKRIYEHLKPGGYVEVQEFQYVARCDDSSCDRPYAWRDFLRYLEAGLGALGSDLNGGRHVEAELRTAGFTDLSCREVGCPVGTWPRTQRARERGRALRDAMSLGLEASSGWAWLDGGAD